MTDMQLTRGLKRVSWLDLIGGGQVVVQGNYAFAGHMKPPHGTSIIDVSDPKNPKLVTTIMLPDQNSHTHKVLDRDKGFDIIERTEGAAPVVRRQQSEH
jgi:hypothetical protein